MRAPDLAAMVGFYEMLGFGVVGGDPAHGYAVLGSGPIALTPMRFLKDDLPNFRGGDIRDLALELERRGFDPVHGDGFDPSDPSAGFRGGARIYDPAKWPAEFHTAADGELLRTDDAGDFLIRDPDGVVLYFDSVPVERARFRAGHRHCTEQMRGDESGDPDLGRFLLEFGVRDLASSRSFYERLGLRCLAEDPDRGTCELGNETRIPFRIGLRQGPGAHRLCFVDADVPAVEVALARHGLRLQPDPVLGEERTLRDPAGHVLCFR